jgi:hypothetical protein
VPHKISETSLPITSTSSLEPAALGMTFRIHEVKRGCSLVILMWNFMKKYIQDFLIVILDQRVASSRLDWFLFSSHIGIFLQVQFPWSSWHLEIRRYYCHFSWGLTLGTVLIREMDW